MAFPTVTDRNVQYPTRVKLTEVSTGVYDIDAVPGNVVAEGTAINAALFSALNAHIEARLSAMYPVGSIYTTTSTTAPATLFGFGTWEAYGVGKVLVGIDGTQTEFDTIGETGGAKTVTLDTTMMPAHTHGEHSNNLKYVGTGGQFPTPGAGTTINTGAMNTGSTGGGLAHNNLQPYQVVYMWRRTA